MSNKLKDIFGIDAPAKAVAAVWPTEYHNHPNVPQVMSTYYFRKEVIRDLNAFLMRPRGDALFITGPGGSVGAGKTTAVEQFAARCGIPVQTITGNSSLQFSDLIGQYVLMADNPGETPYMQWQDGPLTTAWREGHICLFNEMDLVDPGELAGLNDLLEGKPLILTAKGGEVVYPNENFRFIATCNTNGQGDETGGYVGTGMMNMASMDRFRFMEVLYPTEDEETQIVQATAPALSEDVARKMVEVANHVREIFMGNKGTGDLSVTFSTRTLVRWAGLAMDFRGADNTLRYSLERALLMRGRPEDRSAIDRIAADVFGEQEWYGTGSA